MKEPRLVNWKADEETGEIGDLILGLTVAYRLLAPIKGQGPATALEQAILNTVGFKRLDHEVQTTDGQVWALAAEFRAGWSDKGRIKILLPYAKQRAGWLTDLEKEISVHHRGCVETLDVTATLRNLSIRLEHTTPDNAEVGILPQAPEEDAT